MARARKSSPSRKLQAESPVESLEVEFDNVREKLPAEYEKAIVAAERALNSHLKKLDTLKGRLEKAQERLAKTREQKRIKVTAAVQTRFEKAQAAVAVSKDEIAELRVEIAEVRKEIGSLKKRLRKFNFIEKEICKAEKKAVTPRKYRRRKKSRASQESTDVDSKWGSTAEEEAIAAKSSNKELAFLGREAKAEA